MAASSSSIRRIVSSSRPRCHFQCLGDRPTSASASKHPSFPPSRTSKISTSSPSRRAHHSIPSSSRNFGTGAYTHNRDEESSSRESRPRWSSTPRGMSMPFRVRPRSMNNEWTCNEDPKLLGDFYNQFLGRGGADMLSEEARWQAITHKSFDQGKRGFNDKLSYYGRRILDLQTSLALAALPRDPLARTGADQFGRHPYEHPLLNGLPNLSDRAKARVLSKERLAQLGREYGLERVLRWRPKQASNLKASGQELVMAQAVYAILGALALEKGKLAADRVAKDRILRPLGIVREL